MEHVLHKQEVAGSAKIGKTFDIIKDIDKIVAAISEADIIFKSHQKEQCKVLNDLIYNKLHIYLIYYCFSRAI